MSTTTRGKHKKNLQMVKPVIDISKGYDPPLDYTFMCITTMADCLLEEPREGPLERKNTTPPPLFPEPQAKNEEGALVKKRRTNAIRLSNNILMDWSNFNSIVADLVAEPQDLEWIDLSFNDLSCIDKCILQYPKLKVLYLHGNALEKVREIEKLAQLPHLKNLTLHGNPIEENVRGYRHYVISKLPQLKNFDFSPVTKSDCANAEWNSDKPKTRRNLVRD